MLGLLSVVLGLINLALPLVVFFGLEEPGGPFDAPVRVAYYRQVVLAFVIGVVLGLGALIMGRKSPIRLLKIPVSYWVLAGWL